jgi:hypothetical protein
MNGYGISALKQEPYQIARHNAQAELPADEANNIKSGQTIHRLTPFKRNS